MTPDDLAEIRQRADAATPAPWDHVQPEFRDHTSQTVKAADGSVVAFTGYGLATSQPWRNAEFIAHARQDVPDLLAEVDRLTRDRGEWLLVVDRLAAENADLRRQLAAFAEGRPRLWLDPEGPRP